MSHYEDVLAFKVNEEILEVQNHVKLNLSDNYEMVNFISFYVPYI